MKEGIYAFIVSTCKQLYSRIKHIAAVLLSCLQWHTPVKNITLHKHAVKTATFHITNKRRQLLCAIKQWRDIKQVIHPLPFMTLCRVITVLHSVLVTNVSFYVKVIKNQMCDLADHSLCFISGWNKEKHKENKYLC